MNEKAIAKLKVLHGRILRGRRQHRRMVRPDLEPGAVLAGKRQAVPAGPGAYRDRTPYCDSWHHGRTCPGSPEKERRGPAGPAGRGEGENTGVQEG